MPNLVAFDGGQVIVAAIAVIGTVTSLLAWLVKHSETRMEKERATSEARINEITNRTFGILQNQIDNQASANKEFAENIGKLTASLDTHSKALAVVAEGVGELVHEGRERRRAAR